MEGDKQIELIPVEEIHGPHRGGRGGRGGRRGRGRGRGHGREGFANLSEEETLNDSQSGEEKEESIDLITGKSKGKKINRLLRKTSKDNEEIIKAEMEQKKNLWKM